MKKLLCIFVALIVALSLISCGAPTGEGTSAPSAVPTASPDEQFDTDPIVDEIAGASTISELEILLDDFIRDRDYTTALNVLDRMIELEPSDDLYAQRAEIQIQAIADGYEALNAMLAEDIDQVNDPTTYKERICQMVENAGLELVIPFTHDYASEDEINEVGNVSLNLFSGFWKGDDASSDNGVFASQGDWIYYADSLDGFSLHKVRLDGRENQTVTSDWAAFINVIGDWIYYINRSDGDLIYRIRTDGTEKMKLSDDVSNGLCVAEDYIYYINIDANNEIYRMKTDGSEREPFSKPASLIFSDGTWLYFLGPDSIALVRVPLEGGEAEVLLEDMWVHRTQILGDWIYYVTDINGMLLMRMPLGGGESEEVFRFEGKLSSFVISDNLLITSERKMDGSESIWIYDLSTSTILNQLSDASSDSICIASDGSIYFGNYFENDEFYRIDISSGTAEKIT